MCKRKQKPVTQKGFTWPPRGFPVLECLFWPWLMEDCIGEMLGWVFQLKARNSGATDSSAGIGMPLRDPQDQFRAPPPGGGTFGSSRWITSIIGLIYITLKLKVNPACSNCQGIFFTWQFKILKKKRLSKRPTDYNKCWQEYGEMGTFIYCWWEYKMM